MDHSRFTRLGGNAKNIFSKTPADDVSPTQEERERVCTLHVDVAPYVCVYIDTRLEAVVDIGPRNAYRHVKAKQILVPLRFLSLSGNACVARHDAAKKSVIQTASHKDMSPCVNNSVHIYIYV